MSLPQLSFGDSVIGWRIKGKMLRGTRQSGNMEQHDLCRQAESRIFAWNQGLRTHLDASLTDGGFNGPVEFISIHLGIVFKDAETRWSDTGWNKFLFSLSHNLSLETTASDLKTEMHISQNTGLLLKTESQLKGPLSFHYVSFNVLLGGGVLG